MRRPLGCLTFSALLAAVVALLAIGAAIAATGNAMFSPGDLSARSQGTPLGGATSHADLEGRCDACHAPIWSGQTMNDRCVACHATVGEEIAAKTGLHGRLGAGASDCRACHTDHRGTTASLTKADPAVFPHDATGFALTAHQTGAAAGAVSCRDCHPGSPTDYSGTTCLPCHQRLDATTMTTHVDAYGTACLGCHDGKDTYGKAFRHTTYPLVGRHETAECGGCHRGSTTITDLQATSTACVACHAKSDIHAGRLGTSCDRCHTPKGWTDATIDHALTRFPLTGRHVGVACESCHVDRTWTGIGTTCGACHAKDDPHGGQFSNDCASCHATTGWKDVTFDHATTGFPLTQAHATVGCASCHQGGRYAGTPTACASCHARPASHGAAFGDDCASCHTTKAWAPASFDHSRTSFKLTGAHAGLTCARCHKGGTFTGLPTTCVGCHTKPSSHPASYGIDCTLCHTTKAWLPIAYRGPHRFPVGHGGAGGTCSTCHPSSLASYSCARCHSNSSMAATHQGISGYSSTTCAKCHPTGSGGG